MDSEVIQNVACYSLENFLIETLVVNSEKLSKNPLKDSPVKYNLVLKPKNYSPAKKYKLVIVFSGFTGNAGKSFAYKGFQQNYPQILDHWFANSNADPCLFLFVDAMTYWGGSQFINSPLVGAYEDYIATELFPEFCRKYSVSSDAHDIYLMGGSSGGYGAFHLASKYPQHFGNIVAIAPDCDFNLSLLPEIYKALPLIEKCGGIKGIRNELNEGKFFRRKDSHLIINVLAMAYCYSNNNNGVPIFPFELETGLLNEKEWGHWLNKDPLNFIQSRKTSIEKLNSIYLDVGMYDQFNLQYGARKLSKILKSYKVEFSYSEFKGNHFDIGSRRPQAWSYIFK